MVSCRGITQPAPPHFEVKVNPYKIATAATVTPHGIEVVIKGPGIGPEGLRRRFRSTAEADDFVDVMNLAFEQGLKKGRPTEAMHGSAGAGGG